MILLNANLWILIKISLKFGHKGPINNIPALVQIRAWCQPGNKPLSEPVMVRLLTHVCVNRPQCFNYFSSLLFLYSRTHANDEMSCTRPQLVSQLTPPCCFCIPGPMPMTRYPSCTRPQLVSQLTPPCFCIPGPMPMTRYPSCTRPQLVSQLTPPCCFCIPGPMPMTRYTSCTRPQLVSQLTSPCGFCIPGPMPMTRYPSCTRPQLVSQLTSPHFYTPATKLVGYIGFTLSVCLSVRLSVCLSVCPLTFCVRPVASTVQDGFFPYLVQMINSMRGCVACDDPSPWPISSRSFGLDLENCVRSVASTVLDGFFLYLAQMITIIRGCVSHYVFFSESGNLNFWQIFAIFRPWPWKKNLHFSMDSFHI